MGPSWWRCARLSANWPSAMCRRSSFVLRGEGSGIVGGCGGGVNEAAVSLLDVAAASLAGRLRPIRQ
jgi:hypothetical protein